MRSQEAPAWDTSVSEVAATESSIVKNPNVKLATEIFFGGEIVKAADLSCNISAIKRLCVCAFVSAISIKVSNTERVSSSATYPSYPLSVTLDVLSCFPTSSLPLPPSVM